MALFTALATAVGAGLSAAAGTAAAAATAIEAGVGAGGTLLSAAGTGTALYGNIQAGQASREAEAIRNRQMQVNAQRERRMAVRNSMRQAAASRSAGVAQGAFEGSGVGGGMAQAVGTGAQAVGDTNANQFFGQQMFNANDAMSQGRMVASIGSGMNDFGKQLVRSAPAAGRIGATLLYGQPLDNRFEDPSVVRSDAAYGLYN